MDLRPLREPRRILIACALALVLSGTSVIAFSTPGDGGTGLPATWSTPAWSPGDKAAYLPGDHAEGYASDRTLRTIEALPTTLSRGADGTAHRVMTLEVVEGDEHRSGSPFNWTSTYRVSLDDGRTVSRDIQVGSARAGGGSLLGESEAEGRLFYRYYENEPVVPCGTLAPFQGRSLDITGDLVFPGCDGTYRADRLEEVDGRHAMVFAATADPSELWFAQDLAAPLVVLHHGNFSIRHWNLDGFAPGQGDYPPGLEVVRPRPTPELVPVSRWGPEGAMPSVRYTMQDALQDVLDVSDAESKQLADFQRDHPDWMLAQAAYGELEDDGAETYGWTFMLYADGQSMGVLSYRYEDAPEPTDGLPLLGNPQQDEHKWKVFPGREQNLSAPARLPDFDSAIRTWKDEARGGQINGFGFTWSCALGCFASEASTFAGDLADVYYLTMAATSDPLQLLPSSSSGAASSLSLGANGDVVGGRMTTYHESQAIGPQAKPASQGPPLPPLDRHSGASLPAGSVVAGASAGAAFLALLYYLWPLAKAVPGMGLFSRLRTPELVQHPKRHEILDAVHGEPGIHFSELRRRTGLANGTLRHHTRQLVQGGMLQERTAGGYTCFFAGGRVSQAAVDAAPALKSTGARKVFDAIVQDPGATSQDLAARLGLAQGTIGYHLKRLREAGLVDAKRERRSVHLYASDLGRATQAA